LNLSLTQDQFSTIPQEQYKDYFTVPETFNDAWNHPCPFQRKLWRNAIQKELDKMESNKVYRFQQSPADPCLFLFKNALGMMLVIVYVDDVGLAYSSYALVEFLFTELKKRKINYTVENDLTDYLSCEILFNKNQD